MWVSIPGNFDSIGFGWSNGTGSCVHLCVHVCLCFHLILQRFLILVWEYWIYYIKAKVLNKEVAYWTQLHSNRWVQTQSVALFPTWGWQEGCNRERRWEGEAVCCQRGGDLEYAINVHKHIWGVTFKRCTPSPIPTLRESWTFAVKETEMPDVPLNSRLSRAVRVKGIRNVPYCICVWLTRKFIFIGDLWACHHFQKAIVSQGGWELIIK